MAVTDADLKSTMREQWNAAADGWDRWFEWTAREFHPSTAWAIRAAGIGPGSSVLDIGCGAGEPAMTLATLVQPGGRVVATDISPEMLRVAGRRAETLGRRNIEFREMDAERLDFPDAAFDAVTCNYGLMFVPDAVAAVREARRVLKPGGRFAVVAWDEPSRSPFVTIAGGAIAQFFPAQRPNPQSPGAFRFSPPGALEAVLRDGGFSTVSVESVPMTLTTSSPAEYWQLFMDHAAGVKAKVGSLSDDDRARLEASIEAAARPHMVNGRLHLAATPLCARAVK